MPGEAGEDGAPGADGAEGAPGTDGYHGGRGGHGYGGALYFDANSAPIIWNVVIENSRALGGNGGFGGQGQDGADGQDGQGGQAGLNGQNGGEGIDDGPQGPGGAGGGPAWKTPASGAVRCHAGQPSAAAWFPGVLVRASRRPVCPGAGKR